MGSILIDGNNVLFAMRASGFFGDIGRETMVRIIEQWAEGTDQHVTLFFDGCRPQGAMAHQMTSKVLSVVFSDNRTADDLLVDAIRACKDPGTTMIVTSDKAILHEAGARRCRRCTSDEFVRDFLRKTPGNTGEQQVEPEKPARVSRDDAQELLDLIRRDRETRGESELSDLDF